MKRILSVMLPAILICLALMSCNTVSDDDYAMQELYNRSIVAREYADKEFNKFLEQFNSNCEIKETSYGFYTSETPVYVVGYTYSNGVNDDLTYAYKISVNDEQVCSILEEGTDIAGFLFA